MKIFALSVAFLGLASGHNIREEKAKPRRHRTKAVRGAVGPKVDGKALCGEIDLRNAQCYKDSEPAIYNAAKAVIAMRSNWLCTGWLVGPHGYMLTNNHCISSQSDADGWNFHFMYESENGSCEVGGVDDSDVTSARVVSGAEFIWTNANLDATLLKLPGDLVSEFGSYDISDQPPVTGQHIYIPQHPQGRDKSIGITDSFTDSGFCEVGQASGFGTEFSYTCDTQGGSSGSPVVDKNNPKMAIGLHFGGRPDCHGNAATMMSQIYPHVQGWVYGGSPPTPTPPTPTPPTGGCTDLSGWTDSFGDGCEWYEANENGCAAYGNDVGTDGKTPIDACCICDGVTPTPGTDYPSGTYYPSSNATFGGSDACTYISGWTDSYGDGCEWYEMNPQDCAAYGNDVGTDGYTPIDACCICEGVTPGTYYPTSGPSFGGSDACTYISGWTDSYGDNCVFYENTPGACELWGDDIGTDGKTPLDACCVCN